MKLMKALVVMLVAAGLIVPAVAIAEDRLSLSGEMRVRGWNVDAEVGGVDLGSDTWADQRLRIGGKIAIADGVSITFRTDITESNWGSGNAHGSGRLGVQQWDRAHIDLVSGNFHLRAGQQYMALGKTYAFDTQSNGLTLNVGGDVPVTVFAFLEDDNGGTGESDMFTFGAKVKPVKNVEFFVAGQNDGMEEEVYLIGANAALDLDAIKLVGEIDVFTGDADATTDAMGTQLLLDASTAAGAATVGAQFLYAQGDDTDVQYQSIGSQFGGWDPVNDVGTSLSNEQLSLGKPFDWTGQGAGVVGGRLYGKTAMGDTKLGASVAYLETEEDDVVEADVVALAAGLVYPVLENASFQVQLQYQDGEAAGVDFDAFEAGTGLFVKF